MKRINTDLSLEDVGQVKNILDPTHPQDAVTLNYLNNNYNPSTQNKNLDGGLAASVYLATQSVNGGDANG